MATKPRGWVKALVAGPLKKDFICGFSWKPDFFFFLFLMDIALRSLAPPPPLSSVDKRTFFLYFFRLKIVGNGF